MNPDTPDIAPVKRPRGRPRKWFADKRGGYRPGSGRKTIAPENKRRCMTVCVTPATETLIRDAAATLKIPVGQVVDQLAEGLAP